MDSDSDASPVDEALLDALEDDFRNTTAEDSEDSEESVFGLRGTSPERRSCQHIGG